MIGSEFAASCHASIDQCPWPVADRSYRLMRIEKALHEFQCLLVSAKFVGVHDAAWKQQRVVVIGIRLIQGDIAPNCFSPVLLIPCTTLFLDRRYHLGLSALSLQRLFRPGQFSLFK